MKPKRGGECRHENADHCGPDPSRFEIWTRFECLLCLDCYELLSLGPSNDEPSAVWVEMHAARLAADGDIVVPECPFEEDGGCMACRAKELARCIATHTEES